MRLHGGKAYIFVLKSYKVKHFRLILALFILTALLLRVLYAWQTKQLRVVFGDDDWYHAMANGIADGHGYLKPFILDSELGFVNAEGGGEPTAWHPPLFPALLALFSLVGFDSFVSHQIVTCFTGTATVLVVALAARTIAGDTVALIAALLAAVYPPLIMNDSMLMSESLFGLMAATTLLMALRAVSGDYTTGRLALVGLFAGLAALTRSEGTVLLTLFTLVFLRQAGSWQLKRAVVVFAVGVLVISPWVARNWAVLGKPTLATSHGLAVTGSNCDESYYGRHIGFFSHSCPTQRDPEGAGLVANIPGKEDEVKQTDQWNRDGLEYVKDHLDRVPLVVTVRILRTWQLYKPYEQQRLHVFLFSHLSWMPVTATLSYFVVLLFAITGAAALLKAGGRRRSQLAMLAVPMLSVTVVSALSYGAVRLREAAEPSLLVLAAVGVTWSLSLIAARLRSKKLAKS